MIVTHIKTCQCKERGLICVYCIYKMYSKYLIRKHVKHVITHNLLIYLNSYKFLNIFIGGINV